MSESPPTARAAASGSSALATPAEPLPGLREDAERLVQPDNAARLEAVRAILEERGIDYEVQAVLNPGRPNDPRSQGSNLIVTIGHGPSDLVVGAHLDAVPLRGGTHSAGMVDNGAAVVVLTRLIEELRHRALRHRLRVVFFDMEEIGLVGSRTYVESDLSGSTAAMVNLDIAGYGDTMIFGPTDSSVSGALHRGVHATCYRIAVACIDFPRMPPSDDRSFQAAGIPNVSIAAVPRVDAHQLWLMVNADRGGLADGFVPEIAQVIHTHNDSVDRLDPAAMTLVLTFLRELVLELDTSLP